MLESKNELKACNRCGTVHPKTSEFFPYRDKSKGNLHGMCKPCKAKVKKKYFKTYLAPIRIVEEWPTHRVCKGCNVSKELNRNNFYASSNKTIPLDYRCISCEKKRRLKYNRGIANRHMYTSDKEKCRKVNVNNHINSMFKCYKKSDEAKGYEMDITKAYLRSIYNSACTYCGFPCSGLDRIDNSKGHTIKNCVPCCKECNVARMDNFTHEEMKVIGKAIMKVKGDRLINSQYLLNLRT